MSETVLKQVAELPHLATGVLKERWRLLYGGEPPQANRNYLVRRLAYRIQELAFGGLKEETKDRLREIADEEDYGGRTKRATRRRRRTEGLPVPGTKLARTWRGQRIEVTVTRDGIEYEGRIYRSLTAVAKTVTGSHLSGRAFFGLTRRKAAKGGEA
ncbi:MAG: DUF2924 domain-containing protein [Planctomycetes bacterium]|nr:DUF2924 domain-containing protein [Planctomycetota bacterium]